MNDANQTLRKELFVGCMPMLAAFVRRLVGQRELADELFQEVSMRALAGAGPCDRDSFFAWTCGIARHVIGLHWRARRRGRAELPLEEEFLDTLCDPVVGPDGRIDARASLGQVAEEPDREGLALLVRRYVLDEPAKDLASELAQSPAALRMRLMRLRSSLRARVESAASGTATDP